MKPLRFAVIGTGFWANYQIPAWREMDGIELVALYNRTKTKAEVMAHRFDVPRVYDDADELLAKEKPDFVDIITDVNTHVVFTELAAKHGVAVICQKPMAPSMSDAKYMIGICRQHNVPLYIHENWRWQAPIRKLKELLTRQLIGKVFKARVTFCSSFPVFDNQPFLAEEKKFILADIGSHILDVCRFLFGEAETLECHTATVNGRIKGEDVANVFMRMRNGVSCYAEMSYASILEYEAFPQTFVLVEGEKGSLHLTRNHEIHITTRGGTEVITAEPRLYSWVDPQYALVHASIADCNRNILHALQGKEEAETTSADNLETVRLVHASYASAEEKTLIELNHFHG